MKAGGSVAAVLSALGLLQGLLADVSGIPKLIEDTMVGAIVEVVGERVDEANEVLKDLDTSLNG